MRDLTESALRQLLGLTEASDLNESFSDLEVDSWGLIEARTILETRFGIYLTDEEWMSLERPADILSLRSAA